MRQSNPFAQPIEEERLNQPWLYWEPFDTERIETTLAYHYECYQREYDRWKYNLIDTSRIKARHHLAAISKLSMMLRAQCQTQRHDTPRDIKQRLEDPDYEENKEK